MYNFLDYKLLPKVLVKPMATDSYEADNLISRNYSDKIRGFIAYPSKKPPVEVEFEFLCYVNISYIFLNTRVGNHSCSGIELFAQNSSDACYSIAKAIYDAPAVIFCNKRDYSYSNPPPCFVTNSKTPLYFFNSSAYKFFLNASKLKVVIFRTQRSVPCLASVEVWGTPAKYCSQKTVETVHRLFSPNKKAPVVANTAIEFKIPDEFKDELTYQLMSIPYTLPSGKSVDYTTLEKHLESEKSFGRKPSDPFTGSKFTDTLKPVLNVALKSRIDMFLLKNSHETETFNLKRTLRLGNGCKRFKSDLSPIVNLAGSEVESISDDNDGLDILIRKAKSDSNFKSFTSSSDCTTIQCASCKIAFHYLYELPCKHYYCRKCLLKLCVHCVCMQCNKLFIKRDVNRIDLG